MPVAQLAEFIQGDVLFILRAEALALAAARALVVRIVRARGRVADGWRARRVGDRSRGRRLRRRDVPRLRCAGARPPQLLLPCKTASSGRCQPHVCASTGAGCSAYGCWQCTPAEAQRVCLRRPKLCYNQLMITESALGGAASTRVAPSSRPWCGHRHSGLTDGDGVCQALQVRLDRLVGR